MRDGNAIFDVHHGSAAEPEALNMQLVDLSLSYWRQQLELSTE